ncbi:MAG: AsmA family protein, partial [Rhodospirillales bacterium]|nr:AsmA family protein [Rhodospirillales bacterium]
MKKLLLGLLSLIVVAILVAVAVPFFISTEVYKEQITAAARDATGRDLMIGGNVGLSVFPRLELQAEQVTFSNMPRGRAPHMASLDKLVVRLQLLPLLSGEVRVDSFVLVDPVIALEIDHKGRANWEFEGAAPAEEPAADNGESEAAETPELAEISLGDVRLVNGKVSYRDARSGEVIELSNINMTIALPSLDAPAEADGSVVWNGKKVSLALGAENPRALMEGASSALDLTLESEPVSVDFQGTGRLSEPLTVAGKMGLDVPSIRALAAWTGTPLDAPGTGLGPLEITGDLSLKGSRVSFGKAEIGLDGMNASGDFLVDTGAKVPYLKGRLDWDALDLNLYMAPDGGAAPDTQAEDAPNAGGPGDWSDDSIDFSGLKAANADFELSVGSITLDQLKIGRSAVEVGLKNGRLAVDLKELALYGGNGTANLVLNARGKVPLINQSLAFTGVQLEPLLTDAARFDKMTGTANLN